MGKVKKKSILRSNKSGSNLCTIKQQQLSLKKKKVAAIPSIFYVFSITVILSCSFSFSKKKVALLHPLRMYTVKQIFYRKMAQKEIHYYKFFVTFIALWEPSRSKMEKDVEKCLQKKYLSLSVLAS